jgi:hypothetical protein
MSRLSTKDHDVAGHLILLKCAAARISSTGDSFEKEDAPWEEERAPADPDHTHVSRHRSRCVSGLHGLSRSASIFWIAYWSLCVACWVER